jgi:hypothetical protein
MSSPIRILSDLHLGHRVSRIASAESLRPLIAGAGTVIFNGDTCSNGRHKGQGHQSFNAGGIDSFWKHFRHWRRPNTVRNNWNGYYQCHTGQ